MPLTSINSILYCFHFEVLGFDIKKTWFNGKIEILAFFSSVFWNGPFSRNCIAKAQKILKKFKGYFFSIFLLDYYLNLKIGVKNIEINNYNIS